MKILWLSNVVLNEIESYSTGTWLYAMSRGLIDSRSVKLGNISQGDVKRYTQQDFGSIKQWIIPNTLKQRKDGLPSQQIINDIVSAVNEFKPDLIHIWGTEGNWGLLTARKIIKIPALLGIQGIKSAISKYYSGNLTTMEMLKCIGIKEIVRKSTIFHGQYKFKQWGKFEKEIISNHKFIATQSKWSDIYIKSINKNCVTYQIDRILREIFYTAVPWKYNSKPIIFFSAAYPSPFKGLHVAVRALAILKNNFPNIQLRIAGWHPRTGIRSDGYVSWIVREIKRLDLESNVVWLNSLSAIQIIKELQKCSAIVIPSFVESYCLVLAEAMILGVPSVVSYTGGMVNLGHHEKSVLFFPPGDSEICAWQLDRILTDCDIAQKLSTQARETALVRNNSKQVTQRQIDIYRQVLNKAKE